MALMTLKVASQKKAKSTSTKVTKKVLIYENNSFGGCQYNKNKNGPFIKTESICSFNVYDY